MEPIELGTRVMDTVTGYTGIAVARAQYLGGSDRYEVAAPAKEDGEPVESRWFDAGRLQLYPDPSATRHFQQNPEEAGKVDANPDRS